MSEIEPHEVLLDKLAKEKEREISQRKLESALFERPFFLFLVIVIVSFLFFLSLSFFYQIIKHQEFLALAQKNQFEISKIGAERGVIYDCHGEQLTFNQFQFDLYFSKEKGLQEGTLDFLSQILKESKESLKDKILSSAENEVLLARNLDFEKVLWLLVQSEKSPELILKKELKREYKDGPTFSHLLGYLGKISEEEFKKDKEHYTLFSLVGKEGLEKFYENFLRETLGKIQIEKDARGKEKQVLTLSQPEPGHNLLLFLDAKLQRKVREELEKRIKEVGAKEGAVIALNPQTGGVLAFFSFPSFDNNLFSFGSEKEKNEILKDAKNPLLNRASTGLFPLGSTIKPFLALAGLQEKIINERETVNCQGKLEIPHKYNPEIVYTFGDWTVHGVTDLRKAIAESCNVYFYKLGEKLGPQKIKEYLKKFGFGQPVETDFPIPSFAQGFIGDPQWKKEKLKENWWDGDTFNLSIGQGFILATPLQVAQAFLPIANGGKFFKIHFVWKILDSKGRVILENQPELLKESFIDFKNLEIVREGMKKAVTGEGAPKATAKILNSLPVSSGAKTGTAQNSRKDCPGCYTTWMVAFAPYENPEILLVIVIDGVKDVSSPITPPVAFNILDWYFQQKSLK